MKLLTVKLGFSSNRGSSNANNYHNSVSLNNIAERDQTISNINNLSSSKNFSNDHSGIITCSSINKGNETSKITEALE
jgi:hypothetical protein